MVKRPTLTIVYSVIAPTPTGQQCCILLHFITFHYYSYYHLCYILVPRKVEEWLGDICKHLAKHMSL